MNVLPTNEREDRLFLQLHTPSDSIERMANEKMRLLLVVDRVESVHHLCYYSRDKFHDEQEKNIASPMWSMRRPIGNDDC